MAGIYHADFKPSPYWWEAWTPTATNPAEVPAQVRVAIVGGGYGGLSAALELAKNGVDCVVLEANELGFGASTRNGGAVSGGVNIGKSFSGKGLDPTSDRARGVLADGSDAFALIERLIAEESIDCFWQKRGRFVGAWTPKHYAAQEKKLALLNDAAKSGAFMVPRERQREEMASDYYYGGMVVERSASLHPALYYKGLLDACRRRGITICAKTPVQRITGQEGAWEVRTARGPVRADQVVIATNGYTGDITPELKRRVVPLASHIIATEELPEGLAHSLIPKGRTLSDTRRVLCYYRMSPDGKRMVFGGRARFTQVTAAESAPVLYQFMTERFPQLKGVAVTHAWTGNVAFTLDALPHMGRQPDGMHYLLGCNGSGVAMMTYLGWQTARKIAGVANRPSAYDTEDFPTHPLYTGNPWFLPAIGRWYRFRDDLDRRLARLTG
ncbi:NAD(P)/FAD-dependent oxidoreductase [Rhodopila sp.]|jgi:glycine/D-amino acid oxidase-like deaminating enzyme|uniref:NAD(P)/FAD-dependent oxidoreductase n=1 Tax=Rhodopila sp. TaxID=2480087 RepID=UPI002BB19688|nr:FAD-binding oxidoreductase [Rhodopila sp.]HVZ09555.1 FAD-binding oxidoreductase [Rhodopila sp.]